MKKVIGAILIILTVSSCDPGYDKCFHGKFIMSSCCSGSTFIELDTTFPIGKATKLNGKDYKNVIQVPGYLTGEAGEDIYLNLREYDQQKDSSLFPGAYCYCLIGVGMDVPIWIQTGYAKNSCPLEVD
jgi:hypothetical protein